ncbi:TVP38/TMEM64 family protein [Paenibacillaceae bacterium]|nr:TVP38/TMEM64 family protein [Paenibacillaceae bacterium]
MGIADLISSLTEEQLMEWLEQYRSYGPLPGIMLTFLKSFVPPLPTLLIVGVNALVYGLWFGFLYSWIGMVAGCLLTFFLVSRISSHRLLMRWTNKPKIRKGMLWVRRNAFSYVFVLSLFPVGPFVAVNIAAALAGMRFRSFALAVTAGKAIMIFTVSYIGYDLTRYADNPLLLVYIVLFIVVSLIVIRKLEAKFARESDKPAAEDR